MIFAVDTGARKGVPTCGIVQLDPAKVGLMSAGRPQGELVRAWTIDGSTVEAVAAVMAVVKAANGRLLIERQFPSVRSTANPLDLEKLITTRAVFTTLATVMRVPFEIIYPASWQTLLRASVPLTKAVGKMTKPKAPPKPAEGKPAKKALAPRMIHDTKKSARWLAAVLYPEAELGPHEIDAALMGRWWIEKAAT